MFRHQPMALALVILTASSTAWGAFVVDLWDLETSVSERIDDNTINDSESITLITNPLFETIHAQVNDNSFSQASFDYVWSPSLATGEFNTTITHAILAPESRAVTDSKIFIIPAEDIVVTISASLTYSHTPGDLSSINFFASIRDESAPLPQLLNEHRRGGNLYFLPSSGTLTIDEEIILSAGTTYRLRNGLDSSNTADSLPTGTIDATGFVNFSIRPVPEPTTALLLTFAAASIVLQRHRSF